MGRGLLRFDYVDVLGKYLKIGEGTELLETKIG
jgi:hypothetical protein